MAKRNDENDKQQDDQGQNVQVMKTRDGSTMIQTGPDSVQVEVNYGGIHQTFSN